MRIFAEGNLEVSGGTGPTNWQNQTVWHVGLLAEVIPVLTYSDMVERVHGENRLLITDI